MQIDTFILYKFTSMYVFQLKIENYIFDTYLTKEQMPRVFIFKEK